MTNPRESLNLNAIEGCLRLRRPQFGSIELDLEVAQALIAEARAARALRAAARDAVSWLEKHGAGYCAPCDNVHKEPCNECEVVAHALEALRATDEA